MRAGAVGARALEPDVDARRRRCLIGGGDRARQRHHVAGAQVHVRHAAVGRELGSDRAQLFHLRQDVVGAPLEDFVEALGVGGVDLLHVLGREPDRRQRVLHLVGDDARHLGPRFEPLRAQDLGDVLDHQQRRGVAAAGDRHPHHAPFAVLAPGAIAGGGARRDAAASRSASRRNCSSPSIGAIAATRAMGAPTSTPSMRLGGLVVQHHAAVLIERHHRGGDALDHLLDHLLLAQQVGCGSAPRAAPSRRSPPPASAAPARSGAGRARWRRARCDRCPRRSPSPAG